MQRNEKKRVFLRFNRKISRRFSFVLYNIVAKKRKACRYAVKTLEIFCKKEYNIKAKAHGRGKRRKQKITDIFRRIFPCGGQEKQGRDFS